MEMVDAIAINKADGDNKARAERARAEYASALHLFPPAPGGWRPRVLTCSAMTGEHVADIWELVLEHRALMKSNGHFLERRREQALEWMNELVRDGLMRRDSSAIRASPRACPGCARKSAAATSAALRPRVSC